MSEPSGGSIPETTADAETTQTISEEVEALVSSFTIPEFLMKLIGHPGIRSK